MKQILITGLAAALTVAGVSKISPSEASQDQHPIDDVDVHLPIAEASPSQNQVKVAEDQTIAQALPQSLSGSLQPPASVQAENSSVQSVNAVKVGAVKVGEIQPTAAQEASESVIATIQVHHRNGQQAATIYVRNIPVVTMLGPAASVARATGIKVATVNSDLGAIANDNNAGVNSETSAAASSSAKQVNDPVWRATTIVGKLNQLSQSGLDAKDIKVAWDGQRNSYMVSARDQHLIEIAEGSTVLPKSTKDTAQDALQITNRLRYQLGYASPLKGIEGMPKPEAKADDQVVAVGPIRFRMQGWASWYGPGFDGAYTASGERFNQYDLTAAHRSLPFGTRVRVTNLDNGRSVVVRITDRGPFIGGRVLDLSRGAAQILGTVSSGVSPIRMDVLR